jgi:hypothetical protein
MLYWIILVCCIWLRMALKKMADEAKRYEDMSLDLFSVFICFLNYLCVHVDSSKCYRQFSSRKESGWCCHPQRYQGWGQGEGLVLCVTIPVSVDQLVIRNTDSLNRNSKHFTHASPMYSTAFIYGWIVFHFHNYITLSNLLWVNQHQPLASLLSVLAPS